MKKLERDFEIALRAVRRIRAKLWAINRTGKDEQLDFTNAPNLPVGQLIAEVKTIEKIYYQEVD